jgi:hypothetical protein
VGSGDRASVAPVAARGVRGLAQANSMVVLPEQTTQAVAGATVSVMRLTGAV